MTATESFDEDVAQTSRRYLRFLAWGEIICGPGLWWSTRLLHPDSPAMVDAFRFFQVGFGVVGFATLALLSLRSLLRRAWIWIAMLNAIIVCFSLGIATARAPIPNEIPFHMIPCAFFVIPWSVRQRMIAMFSMTGAFAIGNLAVVSVHASSRLHTIYYFACVAIAGFLMGHLLFRVIHENWRQRRALADRASALEERVAERTAELQRLAAHIEANREDERRRIARELHDELGQVLTGIRMEVGMGRRAIEVHGMCARIDGLLDQAFVASRNLIYELRPRVLDDLGLVAAVESYIERFRERSTFEVTLDIMVSREPMPALATTLFRALQESLTNVARHAQATRVDVKIFDDGDLFVLRVEDDGIGFDVTQTPGGFGLLGLRERALAAGGTLDIESRSGSTCMTFSAPWTPRSNTTQAVVALYPVAGGT